jgi:hypothetical protein
VLYAYQHGRVRPFHWDGATLTPSRDVELHGERQHTPAPGDPPLGVAKAVLDEDTDLLSIVLAGYAPTTTWRYDTPPAVIPQQYLLQLDLRRALAPDGPDAPTAPTPPAAGSGRHPARGSADGEAEPGVTSPATAGVGLPSRTEIRLRAGAVRMPDRPGPVVVDG